MKEISEVEIAVSEFFGLDESDNWISEPLEWSGGCEGGSEGWNG